ncbi:MAG: hypothetical protein JWQ14_1152 [Adhaeribacter sp.]|nr:hypothetical protein [Adhaeribacter sp.]
MVNNLSLCFCQLAGWFFQPKPVKFFLAAGLWLMLCTLAVGQDLLPTLAKPLKQGHSHNDYWRSRPLLDALQLGFKSVEADVFLVDGALLVGHSKDELSPAVTLESLYLKPVNEIVKQHKKLYRRRSSLYLYIDFKTEGKTTYEQLVPVLHRYRHLLLSPQHKGRNSVLKVILTGNYPSELVLADKQRLVYLDGKVEELPQKIDAAFFPVVSGNWAKYFTWQGAGAMPPEELRQLAAWNSLAQRNGQQIRFWNMPEKNEVQLKNIWQELLKYPAVLIGTDHLDWLTGTLAEQ